jgi:hypothetical protein
MRPAVPAQMSFLCLLGWWGFVLYLYLYLNRDYFSAQRNTAPLIPS